VIALAAGLPASAAHRAVTEMLQAVGAAAPVSELSRVAYAVTGAGAGQTVVTVALAEGGVLAVEAPGWMASRVTKTASCLLSDVMTVTAPAVAAFFARLTGDCRGLLVLGDTCAAFRGSLASLPLFYAADGEHLYVSSRVRAVRAVRNTEIDLAGLGAFLVPSLCDVQGSAWREVRRLPPGWLLTFADGHADARPVAVIGALDVSGASRAELAEEFRERFVTAVRRASAPPDGVLLSGGIDSSALAGAYIRARDPAGGRAYSLTYDDTLAACDERRYVDEVEAVTGLTVRRLPGGPYLPLLAGFPGGDEPEPWPYAARNWALLRHAAADGEHRPVTLLAGEGGDELLLGQIFTVADRIAGGDDAGAARELATFPDPVAAGRIVRGLLAESYDRSAARLARALGDVPAWLSDRYVRDSGLVGRLAAGYPTLGVPGQIAARYSRALAGEMGAAGRVQCGGWSRHMGDRLGLHIAYPFFDPDLAELVWGLPPACLRDQGLEKAILRDALADLLPASVRRRTDKAAALAMLHAGLRSAPEAIRKIGARGPLVDLGVVDPARLVTAVDRYLAGNLALAPALWATFAVNTWLTEQTEDEDI
jgi:asparagine synthetase B (glutamine-hydrolysing)